MASISLCRLKVFIIPNALFHTWRANQPFDTPCRSVKCNVRNMIQDLEARKRASLVRALSRPHPGDSHMPRERMSQCVLAAEAPPTNHNHHHLLTMGTAFCGQRLPSCIRERYFSSGKRKSHSVVRFGHSVRVGNWQFLVSGSAPWSWLSKCQCWGRARVRIAEPAPQQWI